MKLIREKNESMRLAAYSVIGGRPEQQDALYCRPVKGGCLAVICDGMGGQRGGSLASQKAVETVSRIFRPAAEPQESLNSVVVAVREADRQIAALTDAQGKPLEAGSTVTAVLVQDRKLGWCSVGDSRAYLMRGPDLAPFTQDQNYQAVLDAQKKAGLITEEDYRLESRSGEALISYLGIGELKLIDYSSRLFPLEAGDRILVISDGLYRVLSDAEIARILTGHPDPQEALTALEQEAAEQARRKKITRDNTSAIIIIIQ